MFFLLGALQALHPASKYNLKWLRSMGVVNIHFSINALFLSYYPSINQISFKKIQFNLPHHPKISPFNPKVHKTLVFKFFLQCQSLLAEDGKVIIIHRSSYPYSKWDVETIASSLGFIVQNSEPFKKSEFKVYTPRKGFGDKPDDIFDIGDAVLTDFKFGGRKATGTKDFQKLLGSSNDFDLGVVSSENARKYVKQLPRVLTKSASPLVMYLAEKMLLFDPYKHRSFEDAGSHPFLQSVSEINREGLENSYFVDDTQSKEML